MDQALSLILVLGLSVLVFIAFAIMMFRSAPIPRAEWEEEADPVDSEGHEHEPDRRPGKRRRQAWLVFAAVFLVLGLFVAPKLFGGVFLFFPLFWFRGPRRHRPRNTC